MPLIALCRKHLSVVHQSAEPAYCDAVLSSSSRVFVIICLVRLIGDSQQVLPFLIGSRNIESFRLSQSFQLRICFNAHHFIPFK